MGPSHPERRPMTERVDTAELMGQLREIGDPDRCERCGWKLMTSTRDGCVPGNCSERPLPPAGRYGGNALVRRIRAALTERDELRAALEAADALSCKAQGLGSDAGLTEAIERYALAREALNPKGDR